jgi:hypothetical protein
VENSRQMGRGANLILLSVDNPPILPAGKNLHVVMPTDNAASTSDGVTTPGTMGTLFRIAHSTTSKLNPGATKK